MANLVRVFTESSPPLGFTHASGNVASSIPSMKDLRSGSYNSSGWSASGQRRNSLARRPTLTGLDLPTPQQTHLPSQIPESRAIDHENITPVDNAQPAPLSEFRTGDTDEPKFKAPVYAEQPMLGDRTASGNTVDTNAALTPPHDPSMPYPNGYQFPPPHSTWYSIRVALKSYGRFVLTPFGFLITIYGLNIVAWGGMLFLILCEAAPAMCHPSCNDDNSARKIWLEIDSQILNALFCVTGLGLIPWRFRDLYYLMQWRLQKKESGLRRLAGLHKSWFRLEGSQHIPVTFDPKEGVIPQGFSESVFALPIKNSPSPPLTGERASPSIYWKIDFVIWAYVWNTLLQICLCGVMWGLNRFNRPGWTTGLLISIACIVAAAGGIMAFLEGKAVKKVEGVPVSKEDQEILANMHAAEKAEA